MEEKCTLHVKWVILHVAANDFVVAAYVCSGSLARRAVLEVAVWAFVRGWG